MSGINPATCPASSVAALLLMLRGADSQCAETTRIARGRGRARAQVGSSVIQPGISNGIGD